jgi:hypothetical protein
LIADFGHVVDDIFTVTFLRSDVQRLFQFLVVFDGVSLEVHSLVEESALLEWEWLEGLTVVAADQSWVFWTFWDTSILLTVVGIRGVFAISGTGTLTHVLVVITLTVVIGSSLGRGLLGVVRILTAIVRV